MKNNLDVPLPDGYIKTEHGGNYNGRDQKPGGNPGITGK